MYKFTNTLRNHDSLFNFYSDQNIIGSGRWFLSFACRFSSYFDLPWLIGVFSVLLIAVTAVLVVDVLDIDHPVMAALAGGLLATFPAITQTFYFEFTADGYMLAMVLAALAVRLSRIGDQKRWHYAAAAGCICLSCAIYQAYVSFALVLALCYFALELLENRHTNRELLLWVRNQVLVYVLGLALYYVIWQLIMKAEGYAPTTYDGISTVGQISVQNIKGAIYDCVWSFFLFFLEWNVFRYGLTVFSALNILFLISAVSIGLAAFIRSKIYKQRLQTCLLLLAVLAIPFAVFIWYFASRSVSYASRMEQSICILYIFVGVLFCRWAAVRPANVAALLLTMVVLNNSVSANIFYYKMHQCEERSYATAVEMSTRIHLLDDGTIQKIAVVGHLSGFDDDDWVTGSGTRQLGALKTVNRNLVRSRIYIPLYLGNVLDFQLSYYQLHPEEEIPLYEFDRQDPVPPAQEFHFPICDRQATEALAQSEAVQSMPCWPAADSVQVIDGVIVVKLSNS